MVSKDTTVNCCNGRVGRRLIEMATENEKVAKLVMPAGVQILREATDAQAAGETANCCNGRVGSSMNLQELAKELTGGGQD